MARTAAQRNALAAEARAEELLGAESLRAILGRPTQSDTPPPRQVFVNRSLHLADVELIGFDMDYTLAIYHLRRLEQLSYDMTVERLVTACGYPAEIRAIPYDHLFVQRGPLRRQASRQPAQDRSLRPRGPRLPRAPARCRTTSSTACTATSGSA